MFLYKFKWILCSLFQLLTIWYAQDLTCDYPPPEYPSKSTYSLSGENTLSLQNRISLLPGLLYLYVFLICFPWYLNVGLLTGEIVMPRLLEMFTVLSFSDFCVYREAKRREPLSHCLGIRDDVKISRSERKEDNCHSSIAECSCSTYRCSKVACGSHLPPAPVVSRKGVHIFLDLHHHNCILSVLLWAQRNIPRGK
jgi:hypothetical protein